MAKTADQALRPAKASDALGQKDVLFFPNWDPSDRTQLWPTEYFWRDHYRWLEQEGYWLRPRLNPDWVPSWTGTAKRPDKCEDGQPLETTIIDGTRIADGTFVVFKRVRKSLHPDEVVVSRRLSSDPLASDPRNHCVPIVDVLDVPDDDDLQILVLPLLRKFNSPKFATIGECVDFFAQVFEGLQFMHNHRIAHRDCCAQNIMMNATDMYPEPFHPLRTNLKRDFSGRARHYSRSERPPRYLLIDFGLSSVYDSSVGHPLEEIIKGGDKSVPEFMTPDTPRDPFPIDIYYVGNMVKKEFVGRYHGFSFVKELVDDMTEKDPLRRPDIDEVVRRFALLRRSLTSCHLRQRAVPRREFFVARWYRNGVHVLRTARYICRRVPAIPTRVEDAQ